MIAALFADMCQFTAFAEVSEPEEVLGVLRAYHSTAGEVIQAHGGTIEHFAGDGLMAFFNDPFLWEKHEHVAVAAALELRGRFEALVAGWQKQGYDLGLGIGIATGYATLGRIGFEGRYDYGAVKRGRPRVAPDAGRRRHPHQPAAPRGPRNRDRERNRSPSSAEGSVARCLPSESSGCLADCRDGLMNDQDGALSSAGHGSAPALSVDHLSKRFGDRIAFDDVSFEVGHGEVFGFLGPNGAGKTTTVRTLGTLIAPTSGSATVAGIPLTPENGVEIRRRISIMPESPGLYLRLSVIENLECFADLYEVPDPSDRIDRALRAVNLADRARDACGTLSKGLRQRVALARALLSDPEVLFLDEPTAGLDPVAARDVHELIDELRQRGVTIFLTTHRLEEAERLCDRVAILNTTLRTIGRPDELRDQLFAKTLTVRTLVPLPEPGRVFAGLPAVDSWHQDGPAAYVLAVSDPAVAAPAVTRALVAAGADVLSISESRHSLEDVYLELIDEDEEAGRR